ncbi:MAG: DUF308 domain-containing protein [Ruminococcus sp.]|nr:DUF308 domain-containing protein [Ruminococcus sp.]
MKVFNCILGVFAIFGSLYCIMFPGVNFLHVGWLITILLGAWGVCAIFDYFTGSKDSKKPASQAALGVTGFICGICAAVLSVLLAFSVVGRTMLDLTILYMFCGWLVFSGIDSIIKSIKAHKSSTSKMWIWTLIWGILTLLIALYGCLHPVFVAQLIGELIGFFLIFYGVRLIFTAFETED